MRFQPPDQRQFRPRNRSTVLPARCVPVLRHFARRSNQQSRKRELLQRVSLTRVLSRAAPEVREYTHARAGSAVLHAPAHRRWLLLWRRRHFWRGRWFALEIALVSRIHEIAKNHQTRFGIEERGRHS